MSPYCRDLVGSSCWNDLWEGKSIPLPIDPTDDSLENHRNIQFHRLFESMFSGKKDASIVEVGCANSQWLPYFNKTFGFNVFGIDYTEKGCAQAKAILDQAGVVGSVSCENVFDAALGNRERFDFVVSFGLVEHFSDTREITCALASLLKPGGSIITVVPNTRFLPGFMLRLINSELYAQHVPLGRGDLEQAAAKCGLKVSHCDYFMTFCPSVLSQAFLKYQNKKWAQFVWKAFDCMTASTSSMVRLGIPEFPNRFTSPYLVCIAGKII